jgi:hypothetical protein
MSLYSETIVLSKNIPTIVRSGRFAPYELTIDARNIFFDNKILKVEYIWGNDDIETVSLKPTLPNPEDGNPINILKKKVFLSKSYNLSVYEITINFYTFGSADPFVFKITLNLQNPPIDKISGSYFDEVHLIKTRMFGSNNTLLYTFESKTENNILMSLVNWESRPPESLPPPPPPLPKPYVLLDPFAAKFKEMNPHIIRIPYYGFDNNVATNPDSAMPINNLLIKDLFIEASDAVDSRIEGKDSLLSKPIFTIQDDGESIYERNTDCWAYDLDLTCNSVWNSAVGFPSGKTGSGTLITKRHIIFAAHFEIPEGTTIRFVTNDNVVVERTLIAIKRHPDYSPYFPDLTVGVLNADVPNTITPCKVADDSILNHLLENIINIPILSINQDRYALIYDGANITSTYTTYTEPIYDINSIIRDEYFQPAITGDSGTPQFIIIKDKLVLLSVLTLGDINPAGTSLTYQHEAINQLIFDLDFEVGSMTGYRVSSPDMQFYKIY